MDIFEFLGHPEYRRSGNKVTQLVKHYDEVVDKNKSWPAFGQIKKDGVYALLVVREDGEKAIFSRTGKMLKNVNYVISSKSHLTVAGIYIAELCCEDCSLTELSGIVNPNRVKALTEQQACWSNYFYLAFHDFIFIECFLEGFCYETYTERYQFLLDITSYLDLVLDLIVLKDEYHMLSLKKEAVKDGEEGIVIKNPEAPWKAGHKNWHVMKEVKKIGYDLICIDYQEGKGKYKGKIVNLFFRFKGGKRIKAMLGKGWTHDDAQDMFDLIKDKLDNPIGKIYRVYALEESSKGKLRNPKVGEERIDKLIGDF